MTVRQDVADVRLARPAISRGGSSPATPDGLDDASVRDLLSGLPGEGAVSVARAPRRLEVMGGSAAFMGSLVLTLPLAEHVCAAARLRNDGRLSIVCVGTAARNGDAPVQVPVAALWSAKSNGPAIPARPVGPCSDFPRAVLQVLAGAEVRGFGLASTGGLSIAVTKPASDQGSSDVLGSVAAATLTAVASACSFELPSGACRGVAERLGDDGGHGLFGIEDIGCPLYGSAIGVNLHNSASDSRGEPIALDASLELFAIDSGHWPADRIDKCRRFRTAASMGRFLVDRMIRHAGAESWGGMLAQVSVEDYVHRYRDRIPTRMKGREFLDHFGEVDGFGSAIEAGETYKVRSRTEHPIYENARAVEFADAMRRHARTEDPSLVNEAGECMYASHWSYGQRCGLGSVETDLLVNLIRRRGAASGVIGARVTGLGGGGVVAVLVRRGAAADAAIDDAIRDYGARTGLSARILRGSSDGAWVRGAVRIPV